MYNVSWILFTGKDLIGNKKATGHEPVASILVSNGVLIEYYGANAYS